MKKFKFIDLFSGIGGFHQAMENLGGECVFASDIDKYAIETYKDKKEWKKLVKNAMQVDFNWDKSAKIYKEVYKEITNL